MDSDRLIFLFFDGTGIGPADSANPFHLAAARHLPFFHGGLHLPDGTPLTAIDTSLGLAGLPQSATCQTALFTGDHGPALGRDHRSGYPDRRLRRLIHRDNLLLQQRRAGRRVKFVNAYPLFHEYFSPDHAVLEEDGGLRFSERFPARYRRMISVTTCMVLASGDTPFGSGELAAGAALYQDFSNRTLIEKGLDLPEFSPRRAGEILFDLSRRYDTILYEFFRTDLFAHRHSTAECVELVRQLDELVGVLLQRLDPGRDTLLLTSDHGNLEDLSHRRHTRNPVPLLAWGRHGAALRRRILTLSDVLPAIRAEFGESAAWASTPPPG